MIESVLLRPLEQRLREHKYRCAQTLVFGLPVVALQYFGHKLGGPEAARWVTVIQVVLTGWILFVAATGMLSEGVMLIVARRKLSADLLVALFASAMFLFSCISALTNRPRLFHIVVFVLALWSFAQWMRARLALSLVSAAAGKLTTPAEAPATKSES